MKRALAILVLPAVGCLRPMEAASPQVDRPPVSSWPKIEGSAKQRVAGQYELDLVVRISEDVGPADELAFVLRSGAREVDRYPIIGRLAVENGQRDHQTLVSQHVTLAPGDYEVVLDYHGHHWSSDRVKVADVPYWGDQHRLTGLSHRGTTLNEDNNAMRLSIARWWSDDMPSGPWIIEWRRDGHAVTTTSGLANQWPELTDNLVVPRASDAYTRPEYARTPWHFGEEHELPEAVLGQPGPWEAWAVHAGAAQAVAISFAIGPGGKIANPSDVAHQSVALATRPLGEAEVSHLIAQLPEIVGAIDFKPATKYPNALVEDIPLSPAALRAMFRSKALAAAWAEFVRLNADQNAHVTHVFDREEQENLTRQQRRAIESADQDEHNADATVDNASRRAKLKALRPKIAKLVAANGGPWLPAETPQ